MNKRIWITWENQRRSIVLAKKFGCRLHLIEERGVLRYPKSIFRTLRIVMKEKPDVLFVQNPSMVLAAFACICRMIMKIPLVVDRHTTFLLNKKDWNIIKIFIFRTLHRFTIKHADITIVTNNFLANLVEELGGKPFVLPDMIPELRYTQHEVLKGKFNILLISSFASDEPVKEVLEASRQFENEGINIYITGNSNKLDKNVLQSAPSNVVFTGFLDEQDYVNMLFSVDVVMVLTTSDACMLCGCYEAISAERPLITSDKDVLTDYFTDAVFVDNTAMGIAEGIRKVFERKSYYQDRIMQLKTRLVPEWEERYDDLEGRIHSLMNARRNQERQI